MPFSSPEKPVPNRQSTMRAKRFLGKTEYTSPPSFSNSSLFFLQSAENLSATHSASTESPFCIRILAQTNPSPPLLPPPHTHKIPPSGQSLSASSASAAPARSISSREGTSSVSIVNLSASRICALVSTYRIASPLFTATPQGGETPPPPSPVPFSRRFPRSARPARPPPARARFSPPRSTKG